MTKYYFYTTTVLEDPILVYHTTIRVRCYRSFTSGTLLPYLVPPENIFYNSPDDSGLFYHIIENLTDEDITAIVLRGNNVTQIEDPFINSHQHNKLIRYLPNIPLTLFGGGTAI